MILATDIGKLPQRERTPFRSCPLCRESLSEPLRSADCTKHALYDPLLPPTIQWVRCAGCGHVHTDGYFEGDAERILLSRTQDSQIPGYDAERQREISAELIARVQHFVERDITTWLDVGCGAGSLLMTAGEFGIEAVGLDLRKRTVDLLCDLGYDARCQHLETMVSESFDVISMLDVVEHVADPHALLNEVNMVLGPGGVLVVSMPNQDSSVWRMLDWVDQNPYWGELEHYHNFTRESLYRLLGQHGFEPVSYGVSRRYRACMEVIAKHASN